MSVQYHTVAHWSRFQAGNGSPRCQKSGIEVTIFVPPCVSFPWRRTYAGRDGGVTHEG